MADEVFNQEAWLKRIGYEGSCEPTLTTLHGLIFAHAHAISYESLDIMLGRVPRLDAASLQQKIVVNKRGGYCFEQNMLFRAGLRSLGYLVTSLQGRVVRGLAIDAPRPAIHMLLKVELPEGDYLADVGFGNLAPTAPLLLTPLLEQDTPHEPMRFIDIGGELTLQSRLGDRWEHIYRVIPYPRNDGEYEITNWYTSTHPDSPYRSNIIAARPGPNKTRITIFNARVTVRHVNGEVERRTIRDENEYRSVLCDEFGLKLSNEDLSRVLQIAEEQGTRGPPHPFFS